MPGKPLTHIATITSAHGVRGEVKIHSLSGELSELLTHSLTDATGRRPFIIKKQGIKDNLLIASIEGVQDRNAAELLKGTKLYTKSSPSPSPKRKNQWSYSELIGLEARLESKSAYGKVVGVYNFGAGDIIEIAISAGEKEMLPFTKKFIGDVMVKEGYIVVFPPDYVDVEQ